MIGYAAGQLYRAYCGISGICICDGPEAKWYTSPSSDGQICKVRDGVFCSVIGEGRWDDSSDRCVVCDGPKKVKGIYCSGVYNITGQPCESACGANSQCDDRLAGSSLSDECTSSKLEVNRYCNSNCEYSSTVYSCEKDYCGDSKSCGGQTYYCIYDNGWKWSTSKPTGFCCSNADCPGYDPNTHLKLYCNTSIYRCRPLPKCERNEDCAPGYCCDTITAVSYTHLTLPTNREV